MTWLFWLDVAALGTAWVISAALLFIVVGARLARPLNRRFALFAAAGMLWAVSSLSLRLSLGLEIGQSFLLAELTALAFSLSSIFLLSFTIKYVNRLSRWVDLAIILGVVVVAVLAVPLFRHQVILDVYLEPNGTTTMTFSMIGQILMVIPALYQIWSLLLFIQAHLRNGEIYLILSVIIWVVGFILGGIFELPYPILGITTTFSVAVLGYGVVSRQVFNPLRESERFLQNVFDGIQDGISVIDRDLNVMRANHWMERMYVGQSDLLQKKCYVVYQQRDSVCPWCPAVKTLETGEAQNVVVPYPVAGGPQGWISLSTYPLRDASGKIVGVVEHVKDITEQRRAEMALNDYAERLKGLHQIDQAILEAHSSQQIAERALAQLRNLVPCQRASVVLFDFKLGEGELLAVSTADETVLNTGDRLPIEQFGDLEPFASGGERYIESDPVNMGDDSLLKRLADEGIHYFVNVPIVARGRLMGLLNMGSVGKQDISPEHVQIAHEVANQLAVAIQNARLLESERKRSEELEALRQANLKITSSLELQPVLETILEYALRLVAADNAHIFLYDGERLTFGAAMWASGEDREIYPQPRENGLTYAVVNLAEMIVVPDVDAHPLFTDRQWGGAVVGLPLRFGEEIRGEMNVAFEHPHIFDESELNVLALLADQAAIAIHNAHLHQHVRVHAYELAQSLARQQELDRLKGEFIQNVSHELRSPLALIRGYAEMLDGGGLGPLKSEQQQPVAIVARRSRMLSELVEDITLIMEAEVRPLEREPIAIDDLVRTAVDDFHLVAEQKDISLGATIEANVPPVPGALTYLRRVLDNLLGNAIKFTPVGGTIHVRVWREETVIVVEVRDTGIGIPPDQFERIFDRFYQVDGSSQRRYGGVGLGLALVKEIVERHGGAVSVASEVGVGSAFTVRLPLADQDIDKEARNDD